MKKTLVALAVLGSFAGVASAATSVTLYGRVDVGYESRHHDGLKLVQGTTSENSDGSWLSGSDNMSRFGIKGEDRRLYQPDHEHGQRRDAFHAADILIKRDIEQRHGYNRAPGKTDNVGQKRQHG